MARLYYNNKEQIIETMADKFQPDTSTEFKEFPTAGKIRYTNIITMFSVVRDLFAIVAGFAIAYVIILWLHGFWINSLVENSTVEHPKDFSYLGYILLYSVIYSLIALSALIFAFLAAFVIRKIPIGNTLDFDYFANKIKYNIYFNSVSAPFPDAVFIAIEHTYTVSSITRGKYKFKRVIQLLFDVNSGINFRNAPKVDFKYEERGLWNRHKYYVVDEFDNEDDQGLNRLRAKWKYIVSFYSKC